MTIKEETNARITTQLALRGSARVIKHTMNDKESMSDVVFNNFGFKGKSKFKILKFFEEYIDKQCKGSLVSKDIIPNKRRTSKDKAIEWLTLDYDSNKPFTRREEHLIHVSYIILSSKHLTNAQDVETGIYVTRHILERIALRKKVSSLKDICAELSLPLKVLFSRYQDRQHCYSSNNKGLVLITNDAYFIVDSVDDPLNRDDVMFKTMIPKSEWSLKNNKKLGNLVNSLSNDEVAIMKNEDFEKSSEIKMTDASITSGKKESHLLFDKLFSN